jgi:hypothetical protein
MVQLSLSRKYNRKSHRMKSPLKKTNLILTKLIIISCLCAIWSGKMNAQTPAPTIPNFVFYSFDKTPFTNENLSVGKKILFIFFDVTCEHCQHTIKSLNDRIKDCKDISIYLLTLDAKPSVNTFLNTYGKNLINARNVTILQDTKNQFIMIFGPRKYPSVFLYSADRKLMLYDDEDQTLGRFFKLIKGSPK